MTYAHILAVMSALSASAREPIVHESLTFSWVFSVVGYHQPLSQAF